MKTLSFILLALLKSTTVFSQGSFTIKNDTINLIDHNGRKQGIWKEYWSNGKPRYQCSYINGKKDGVYLFFEENGEFGSIGFYKKDTSTGWGFEYRNNKLWRSRFYINSIQASDLYEYNDNEIPETGGNLQFGNGQRIEYFNNGEIKEITSFRNYKRDGFYYKFFRNGQIQETGTYLMDKLWTIIYSFDSLGNKIDMGNLSKGNGYLKTYYSNSLPCKIEEYQNGLYWNTIAYLSIKGDTMLRGSISNGTGEMLDYHENGKIKSEKTYRDGVLNGKCSMYRETGIRYLLGNYLNGFEDGEWVMYDEKGREITIYNYKNGKLLSISDLDPPID
jgi:antitoxin component YwqK of YwqJK toxin-antitoxin module